MKLKTLLVEVLHIPSNEVKTRLKNKQVKINNEIVTNSDQEIDVIIDDYQDLGKWLTDHLSDHQGAIRVANTIAPGGFRDFFGPDPTNVPSLMFFTEYTLITVSKREEYVFKHHTM
jgi:hypothetical protein